MLHFSGIDTSHYAAHSCHSASSSKARVSGVSMEQILKCGQWKSSHTLRFYNKDIVRLTHAGTQQFVDSILASEVAVDDPLPL